MVVVPEGRLIRGEAMPLLRLFLGAGILGAFPTYPTFSYETLLLVERGRGRWMVWNVPATVGSCLAASGLGLFVVRALTRGG